MLGNFVFSINAARGKGRGGTGAYGGWAKAQGDEAHPRNLGKGQGEKRCIGGHGTGQAQGCDVLRRGKEGWARERGWF